MSQEMSRKLHRLVAYATQLIHSASFYPITTFWIGAGVVLAGTVGGNIPFMDGILSLSVLAALLIIIANHRDTIALKIEVTGVHRLVNSQHEVLVKRISQLIDALVAGGIPVPREKSKGD